MNASTYLKYHLSLLLLEISFRKPGNANPWGDSSISFREAVSSALKIRRLLGRFVSMLIHLRLFIIT